MWLTHSPPWSSFTGPALVPAVPPVTFMNTLSASASTMVFPPVPPEGQHGATVKDTTSPPLTSATLEL